MKYVILVGDGMGDYPRLSWVAKPRWRRQQHPPWMNWPGEGELGCARTIPPGKEPGSDIANLAIMGYDPARYHTGRAPLEAAALGVDLAPGEVAFRCNLVTLRHEAGGLYHGGLRRRAHHQRGGPGDHPGPGFRPWARTGRRFYPGVSYRHLLVWTQGDAAWRTYPPHDWTGKEVGHLHGRGRRPRPCGT